MDELGELLKPSWGSEQWILEGWNQISQQEKALIKSRMDTLFRDGLPFELKHDRLLYIYTFSMLAQLEVLAIQVPLKFEAKMSTAEHRLRMRTQLLDEIFHGLVFTKILYLLCAPHALPPAYNEGIEILCNFIRNEECPKVAVVLLNLIGEAWIEEIFNCLQKADIAPEVFTTIIADEHRHVCEADLYKEIGLPDMEVVRGKLEFLEKQLISIFLQYKYMVSISTILGVDGAIGFLQALNDKHTQQLAKINLQPGENWLFFMKVGEEFFPRVQKYTQRNEQLEMTPIRKLFMTQWDNPSDPTMAGEFSINVTCLDFFNKKFPPETLTTLMLQTISKGLSENPSWRSFLSHGKLYQRQEASVGLIVKLPDCQDHIGSIVLENCHNMRIQTLALKIRNILRMMVYCFKKREQLEKEHPFLASMIDSALYEFSNDFYAYPMPGNAVVSLSNIGFYGYTGAKSPLRSTEAMRYTLLEIERRPVWNKETKTFEPQDMLPISISADHRIFDGNSPLPKLIAKYFDEMFEKMLKEQSTPIKSTQNPEGKFIKLFEQLIANNLELGYKALLVLQTYWVDALAVEELLNGNLAKKMLAYFK
ncbi:putative CoA-dependent acyltransferase [Legionella lansingensis]|uniref:Putative CoA-dependent acyltransferase n=1 Tax=Legionella lansingensis TaxID=45067 RepID=A0A0W0VQC2_9GAMM|nr:2-oxo acid dehydrogenase subunit E2 [Legionella lansingensis]KTD22125.1 putative CoA-dependent acyltransferase [Legionella lansingensis]SNV54346.1 putative CoA-dependent acyltransferase [Legionella lansingensis]